MGRIDISQTESKGTLRENLGREITPVKKLPKHCRDLLERSREKSVARKKKTMLKRRMFNEEAGTCAPTNSLNQDGRQSFGIDQTISRSWGGTLKANGQGPSGRLLLNYWSKWLGELTAGDARGREFHAPMLPNEESNRGTLGEETSTADGIKKKATADRVDNGKHTKKVSGEKFNPN